jgi:digeranylgeranylglycerophospholipid reductase
MTTLCDVLVVGGGPAGCSAARASAMNGAKTILVEEHEEIGKPVQCAEGIGKYLIPFLPFKIPAEQLRWEIKGMTFWARDILIERNGGIWSGYTIDRGKWDSYLASLAQDQGADIRTNSKLVDLEISDEYIVKKAFIEKNKNIYEVEPKVIVGADGVDSSIVNLLGVKKKAEMAVGEVKGYEMDNLSLRYPNHDQLFTGDFSHNAYAYIFPISNRKANVGIGVVSAKKEDVDTKFEEFLEIPSVKRQIGKGKYVIEKDGYAPFKYLTDKWNYGNVLLAGDSGNQNFKPFIEGNLPGIICGNIAGFTSAKAAKDISYLSNYRDMVFRRIGLMFNVSDKVMELLLKIQGRINYDVLSLMLASNICSLDIIKKLIDCDDNNIIEEIQLWKNSKICQFKTKMLENFYLMYLALWRKTRLF